MKKGLSLFCTICALSLGAIDIILPAPRTTGGMPLFEALRKRCTIRQVSAKPLSRQLISDLLWSANGINREDGRRTAPTARNFQELELYVLLPEGGFYYDAARNKLIDLSPIAHPMPVTVVIVCNVKRQPDRKYQAVDAGFIGQNIYLFAAAHGLASTFRGRFDDEAIRKELNLKPFQQIMFVHTIGYPAGKDGK